MGPTMIPEMISVAILGGMLAVDRAAGWNLMLSQPLVGACLAGALVSPGPDWEIWALRVPIGIGVLLQLLLTDASLPAAQRQHDTATAGVVGSTVALLAMERLHHLLPVSVGGALWVLVGVLAGLLAAVAGGVLMGFHRDRNRVDVARAERVAAVGNATGFEFLYWGSVLRIFCIGAFWSWGASLLGLAASLAVLPQLGEVLTGRRVGLFLAVLLGAGLAAAYHAHVAGRRGAIRWVGLGAAATWILAIVVRTGAP